MDTKKRSELFWKRVVTGPGCWTHSGSKGSHGYPQATRLNGQTGLAHRVSWEINVGDIPAGMFVCHKCNNRECVRPSHLYVGTHKENMDDMARVGHVRRKLTNEQARLVRSDTRAHRAIAAEYGVSQKTIQNIKEGVTYRYV